MTKEELREQIACKLCPQSGDCDSAPTLGGLPKHKTCERYLLEADQIIKLIKDAGYIQLDEDQSLPDYIIKHTSYTKEGLEWELNIAGYKKVKK